MKWWGKKSKRETSKKNHKLSARKKERKGKERKGRERKERKRGGEYLVSKTQERKTPQNLFVWGNKGGKCETQKKKKRKRKEGEGMERKGKERGRGRGKERKTHKYLILRFKNTRKKEHHTLDEEQPNPK